jgi:hypothetical protein
MRVIVIAGNSVFSEINSAWLQTVCKTKPVGELSEEGLRQARENEMLN